MDNLSLMEIPVAFWQASAIAISAAAIAARIFYKKHQQKLQRAASRAAARLRFEVYR